MKDDQTQKNEHLSLSLVCASDESTQNGHKNNPSTNSRILIQTNKLATSSCARRHRIATTETQDGLTENHAKDLEALRLGARDNTRRPFTVGWRRAGTSTRELSTMALNLSGRELGMTHRRQNLLNFLEEPQRVTRHRQRQAYYLGPGSFKTGTGPFNLN